MVSNIQRPGRGVHSRMLGGLVAAGMLASSLWSVAGVAKDLFVSPSGDDSVSYASNSISAPWKTIDHGLYNLKAGDRLNIRGGTYSPQYPVWLSTDYNRQTKGGDPKEVLRSETGTAASPVLIQNYQNEQVVVDLAAINSSNGAYINLDGKSYWTFRGLTFVNSTTVVMVGEDQTSTNNTFDGLRITANRGGDNAAGIHLWSTRADYTVIRNCVIKGPGQSVHHNTGTIYVKGVNHLKILNNVLSDAPIGIYYKHRNIATSASQVDIEIAYNYITNTSRASLEYNANYSRIHDNVFGVGTAAAHFGDANGGAGADYNTIEHNTFFSGAIAFDSAVESGDPFPGVMGNTVVDNIFRQSVEVLKYSSATNTNTLGKNLYAATTSILSYSSLVRMISTALVGAPTFIGGATPTTAAGFALTANSIGKGAATDGSDIGADVSKMGTGAKEPSSPSDLRVL